MRTADRIRAGVGLVVVFGGAAAGVWLMATFLPWLLMLLVAGSFLYVLTHESPNEPHRYRGGPGREG